MIAYVNKPVKLHWAHDNYLCLSSTHQINCSLNHIFFNSPNWTCPIPWPSGNFSRKPTQRNAKPTLAEEKAAFKHNWEDMTQTPVFVTLDWPDIWILSGWGRKTQNKKSFLCLVLGPQWNLCCALQTEPLLSNAVQAAESVAKGHFGKRCFKGTVSDTHFLKLTYLDSCPKPQQLSRTSTAWVATL